MRLRVKKFDLLILFILLLEVNFFNLIPLPMSFYTLNSHFHKLITFVLSVILFAVSLLKRKNRMLFSKYILIFLLFWMLLFIHGVLFLQNTDVLGVFFDYYYYWIIVLYFYLNEKCRYNDHNFTFLIESVKKIATIYSFILLVQFFALKIGIRFLAFNQAFLTADETGRMMAGFEIVLFASAYLCGDIFGTDKKTSRRSLIYTFINIMYLALVAQSRSSVFILLVIIYLSAFINIKNKKYRRIITVLAIITLAACLFASYNSIVEFFLSNRPSSYRQRIREIEFYTQSIFSNGLIGIGFLRDNVLNSVLLHGFENLYYLSDIGLLGFIAVWGTFGILLVLYFVYIAISILKKSMQFTGKYYNYIISSLLYLVMTSVNLSVFDVQRIVYFPILLTIIDCSLFRLQNYGEVKI